MSATISSIFLVCRDLPASLAFYGRLGIALTKSTERTAVFELGRGDGPELHLHSQLSAQESEEFQVCWQPGSRGLVLSFQVDNLDETVALIPPKSLLVSIRTASWGTRLAVLVDPDGYRVELRDSRKQAS